jgi:hypothetical protein
MKIFRESWPTWAIFSIIVVLVIALAVWMTCGIPDCPVCGQKEYHLEVVSYITTYQMVGKVMVPSMTPIYRSVPHVCPGRR